MPLLFFQAVLAIWTISLRKGGACATITSKMVLSRDPARIISLGLLVSSFHPLQHQQLLLDRVCAGKKVKLRSCRHPPVFPRRSRFVLGKLCFSAWHTRKIWYIVKGHSKIGLGIGFGWALISFAVMATPRPSQHARSVLEVTSHSEAVTVRPWIGFVPTHRPLSG